MRDFWRLLRLFDGSWRWLLAGIGLMVLVILANVGLLALSGWFIAAMALAGLGTHRIEYFLPAAAIRGLAMTRTFGRYLERLITHEATFRLLARLRVWFYEHLEPLAPARLQYYRGGDLLSRIRADIDSLDNVYLRVLAPSADGHHHRSADDALPRLVQPACRGGEFCRAGAGGGRGAVDGAPPLPRAGCHRRSRCGGPCARTSRIPCGVSASCWSIRHWIPNLLHLSAAVRR